MACIMHVYRGETYVCKAQSKILGPVSEVLFAEATKSPIH